MLLLFLVFYAFYVVLISLQLFLATRKKTSLGLILPVLSGIFFLFAIIIDPPLKYMQGFWLTIGNSSVLFLLAFAPFLTFVLYWAVGQLKRYFHRRGIKAPFEPEEEKKGISQSLPAYTPAVIPPSSRLTYQGVIDGEPFETILPVYSTPNKWSSQGYFSSSAKPSAQGYYHPVRKSQQGYFQNK